VFPIQIKSKIIEILAKYFTTDEIDLIGKEIFPKFNAHLLSGQPFGTILHPDIAAKTLIDFAVQNNKLKEITEILINITFNNGAGIIFRQVNISEIHDLLSILSSFGYHYKNNTLILTEEKDKWGYLQENNEYYFAYMSIDIVGNSQIQLKYDKNLIQEVYGRLQKLIRLLVEFYDGKIWNWAGDGGIAAFYIDNVEECAVYSALKIFYELSLFNLNPQRNKFAEPIKLRIGIHAGNSIYKENKGNILSDAINFVAHLEKNYTNTNHISISKIVYDKLNPRLQKIFEYKGKFENYDCYHLSLDFSFIKF
jgi:class 3 adenylate cyclase